MKTAVLVIYFSNLNLSTDFYDSLIKKRCAAPVLKS